MLTYQTRPDLSVEQSAVLDAYAALHGRVQRSLFAAIQAGGKLNDIKRDFLIRFGITARQFNALRVELDGKIASIKERRPELIIEAETRIRKAMKVIAKLQKTAPHSNKLHQKKRRLVTLQHRLAAMKDDQQAGTVRLCFGSKKRFHAQYDLEANGYADHAEWKADWQRSRADQFFVLGSQDESAGNQTCQAAISEDGSLTLKLRLPEALGAFGKIITIPNVRFAYGHETIVAALGRSQRIATQTKAGKPTIKRIGSALSYRFVRDDKSWRIFVSVEALQVEQLTNITLGAIGVDVNADHLAVSETDRFGNLIETQRIDLVTYGKTTDQSKALISEACKLIVERAQSSGKPVVIEKLNFQKKKAELDAVEPGQARMLSSFTCNKVASGLRSAGVRSGVEVIEVNPAYTSVIGALNHAQSKGISVHQGAAYAIARRGLSLSERPAVPEAIVPMRNGGHVTFALPVRNRQKHVWSFWGGVRKKLTAAHAEHFRRGANAFPPPPLTPDTPRVLPSGRKPSLGAFRDSTARLRSANRSQNGSESVLGDVPF